MRIRAIGQGAIQAAFVATLGFVVIFLLNLITWLVEQTNGQTFNTVIQTSSRIWLNAHFVPINIAAGKVAGITVPSYEFYLVPLGFAALLAWIIFRAGQKLAEEENLGLAWSSAITSYLVLAIVLTSVSHSKQINVVDWQGVFYPTAIFAFWLMLGSLVGKSDFEPALRIRIRDFFRKMFERLPWAIQPLVSPALRAGTAVVAALATVSCLLIATLLAVNWVDSIRLYQSLQLSFFGTVTVSLGQLALLPNAIVYVMSWLTGVGFSLGQGSAVSPLATELGPLPPLPMFAALPSSSNSLLIIFILVPLLASFFATLLIKPHTADLRFNYSSATSAAIALGLGIGLVAAIEMAVLADLTGGSIGPGRMTQVGVDPLAVFAITFIEVAVASILAAFFSARPEGVDTELVQRTRRLK